VEKKQLGADQLFVSELGEDAVITYLDSVRTKASSEAEGGPKGEPSEPYRVAIQEGGKVTVTGDKGAALPVYEVPLEALPPEAIKVVLEIGSKVEPAGRVYKQGGARDFEPPASGQMRAWHTNELGLLPKAPTGEGTKQTFRAETEKKSELRPSVAAIPEESFQTERGRSYHQQWAQGDWKRLADTVVENAGGTLKESGLYEFNVAIGANKARILYDYLHDRFILIPTHYEPFLKEEAEGKAPTYTRYGNKPTSLQTLRDEHQQKKKESGAKVEVRSPCYLVKLPATGPKADEPAEAAPDPVGKGAEEPTEVTETMVDTVTDTVISALMAAVAQDYATLRPQAVPGHVPEFKQRRQDATKGLAKIVRTSLAADLERGLKLTAAVDAILEQELPPQYPQIMRTFLLSLARGPKEEPKAEATASPVL